jgi:hypothetical protein
MCTRHRKKYFWGVERGRHIRLTTSRLHVSRLPIQCGILNISQPYRPPRPFMGVAFTLYFILSTPCPESASELYRPSDRRLSPKLVPTFAYIGSHVVSATDSYCRILCFLDRNTCYYNNIIILLFNILFWV